MRSYNIHFKFGLWLMACMPLSSHAALEMPYWLYPEWIVTKVVDFHTRNSDRLEQAQALEKAKSAAQAKTKSTVSNQTNTLPTTADTVSRQPKLAPVEYATPKINEKQLSKEELHELRMQLRQKP
jgi:uncharacterized protein with NAD-binding domain and iron-sulfur cluster